MIIRGEMGFLFLIVNFNRARDSGSNMNAGIHIVSTDLTFSRLYF